MDLFSFEFSEFENIKKQLSIFFDIGSYPFVLYEIKIIKQAGIQSINYRL